ncbi:MAG: hypothetical protein C4583_02745 [Anaerolineaceae bacterium]|nr:MAG: hypothetical protein C4583_02745 [Anaerolineaceae bacterium]
MLKKTLAVRSHFKIVLPSAAGDLRLIGWEREEVSAKTDGDSLDLVLDGETVTVSCDDDLILNVPHAASVQVNVAHGDVEVRTLAGALSFGSVAGDLSLREIGALQVDTVEGDVSVRSCAGDVSIMRAECDVSLRDVQGSVNLDAVADDLFVRGVKGSLHARVEEDAVMYLEPLEGNSIDVFAEGDILLHVPAKANANLSLEADEPENITVQVPASTSTGDNPLSVMLGTGDGAAIHLKAEGDILVTSESKEWESAMEFDFGAGWPLPEDFSERINHRVQEATSRAQRHAEAATRRAEANMRRVEENIRRQHGRRFSFNWSGGRAPFAPPVEPVSDAERMAILKMLHDKKITAEDAEKLLSALEGGK